MVPYFIVDLTSAFPWVARCLFTTALQHMKRNWLQRLPAVVIYKRSNIGGVVNTQPPAGSNIYETHTNRYTDTHALPVWLLCVCVREARQSDSRRLHTPTPQIQGPRSRILPDKKKKKGRTKSNQFVCPPLWVNLKSLNFKKHTITLTMTFLVTLCPFLLTLAGLTFHFET